MVNTAVLRKRSRASAGLASAAVAPDDFRCAVCLDILLDPCVGQCGHDFCKRCLLRWRNASRSACVRCPLCKQSVYAPGQAEVGVCVRLKTLVEKLFPELVAARRRAAENDDEKFRSKPEQDTDPDVQGQGRQSFLPSHLLGIALQMSAIEGRVPISALAAAAFLQSQAFVDTTLPPPPGLFTAIAAPRITSPLQPSEGAGTEVRLGLTGSASRATAVSSGPASCMQSMPQESSEKAVSNSELAGPSHRGSCNSVQRTPSADQQVGASSPAIAHTLSGSSCSEYKGPLRGAASGKMEISPAAQLLEQAPRSVASAPGQILIATSAPALGLEDSTGIPAEQYHVMVDIATAASTNLFPALPSIRASWQKPQDDLAMRRYCALLLVKYVQAHIPALPPPLAGAAALIFRWVEAGLYRQATSRQEYLDALSLPSRMRGMLRILLDAWQAPPAAA